MNTKRFFFWLCFIIVIGLIVWGLIVAMNKGSGGTNLAAPAPVSVADHVLGSSTAPVTLIEYSDFQCPACETYYQLVKRLYDESSSTMRLVYRQFPLDNLLGNGQVQHPNADAAAWASEAAGVQGKFWQMHDELFANHTDWTELADPLSVFQGYATKIGLDLGRFKTDMSSSTLHDFVSAEKDEGIHLGINQTPTFFINGKVITNPQGYEQFKALIDAAATSSTQ
jgi:protein-disulfide isomerase